MIVILFFYIRYVKIIAMSSCIIITVIIAAAAISISIYYLQKGEGFITLDDMAHPTPVFDFDSNGNERLRREMSYETTPSTMGYNSPHIYAPNYAKVSTIPLTTPGRSVQENIQMGVSRDPYGSGTRVVEAVPYRNDTDAYFQL